MDPQVSEPGPEDIKLKESLKLAVGVLFFSQCNVEKKKNIETYLHYLKDMVDKNKQRNEELTDGVKALDDMYLDVITRNHISSVGSQFQKHITIDEEPFYIETEAPCNKQEEQADSAIQSPEFLTPPSSPRPPPSPGSSPPPPTPPPPPPSPRSPSPGSSPPSSPRPPPSPGSSPRTPGSSLPSSPGSSPRPQPSPGSSPPSSPRPQPSPGSSLPSSPGSSQRTPGSSLPSSPGSPQPPPAVPEHRLNMPVPCYSVNVIPEHRLKIPEHRLNMPVPC